MKTIYVFDKNISKEAFKAVMDKFPDEGPTPMHIDEVLHGMLAEGKIHIWIDPEDKEDPIHMGFEIPQAETIKVISNPV